MASGNPSSSTENNMSDSRVDEKRRKISLGHQDIPEAGDKPSILHSWKDVARRARIFSYCKVEAPESAEPEKVDEDGNLDYQSVNEKVSKGAWKDEIESSPGRQSVSNPFHFAPMPIEKITMLNEEVNLVEREMLKHDSHSQRSHANTANARRLINEPSPIIEEDDDNGAFQKEDEVLPPIFQRLSLLGDNVSGVSF